MKIINYINKLGMIIINLFKRKKNKEKIRSDIKNTMEKLRLELAYTMAGGG